MTRQAASHLLRMGADALRRAHDVVSDEEGSAALSERYLRSQLGRVLQHVTEACQGLGLDGDSLAIQGMAPTGPAVCALCKRPLI